jgi:hypothetical protein
VLLLQGNKIIIINCPEISHFYLIWRFNAVLTTTCCWTLSWVSWIQLTDSYSVPLRYKGHVIRHPPSAIMSQHLSTSLPFTPHLPRHHNSNTCWSIQIMTPLKCNCLHYPVRLTSVPSGLNPFPQNRVQPHPFKMTDLVARWFLSARSMGRGAHSWSDFQGDNKTKKQTSWLLVHK